MCVRRFFRGLERVDAAFLRRLFRLVVQRQPCIRLRFDVEPVSASPQRLDGIDLNGHLRIPW